MSDEQEEPNEYWIAGLAFGDYNYAAVCVSKDPKCTEEYKDFKYAVRVIKYSAYENLRQVLQTLMEGRAESLDALTEELKKERAKSLALRDALEKTKGAMTYAYEDHVDQYYLNVLENIEKALKAFDEGGATK
jgi:molecular chaperone GrpE (heat shock protein)